MSSCCFLHQPSPSIIFKCLHSTGASVCTGDPPHSALLDSCFRPVVPLPPRVWILSWPHCRGGERRLREKLRGGGGGSLSHPLRVAVSVRSASGKQLALQQNQLKKKKKRRNESTEHITQSEKTETNVALCWVIYRMNRVNLFHRGCGPGLPTKNKFSNRKKRNQNVQIFGFSFCCVKADSAFTLLFVFSENPNPVTSILQVYISKYSAHLGDRCCDVSFL